jgi:leader peptidase (prepilin peptidase)/N-methyltransferase
MPSTFLQLLQQNPWISYGFIGIIGLCVGSFLNVVIYRLPVMLKQRWRQECLEFLQTSPKPQITETKINLAYPRSHCPYCNHPIRWWQNIPLISYLMLVGRCHFCRHRISLRYPLVELLTALSGILLIACMGVNLYSLAAILFLWSCIPLVFIDIEQQLLPDKITMPLLWLGLLINTLNIFTTLQYAVWGAILGYLIFAILGWCFHKLRGIEGIGQGDYKLLACCGAWLGFPMLLPIILLSSILGLLLAIILLGMKKMSRQTPIPFGPFIILAAVIVLFFHQEISKLFFGI